MDEAEVAFLAYTHVLEDMQHEAADRVGEAFAAARKRAL
jgi:hypothetical protein